MRRYRRTPVNLNGIITDQHRSKSEGRVCRSKDNTHTQLAENSITAGHARPYSEPSNLDWASLYLVNPWEKTAKPDAVSINAP